MGGCASSSESINAEQIAQIHKRITYAEAREKFKLLSPDTDGKLHEVFSLPPASTNFLVSTLWTSSANNHYIEWSPLGKEIAGQKIKDTLDAIDDRNSIDCFDFSDSDDDKKESEYFPLYRLRYFLDSPLYYADVEIPTNLIIGLTCHQYQILFQPPDSTNSANSVDQIVK